MIFIPTHSAEEFTFISPLGRPDLVDFFPNSELPGQAMNEVCLPYSPPDHCGISHFALLLTSGSAGRPHAILSPTNNSSYGQKLIWVLGWIVLDTLGVPTVTARPREAAPLSPFIPNTQRTTGSLVSKCRTKGKNRCGMKQHWAHTNGAVILFTPTYVHSFAYPNPHPMAGYEVSCWLRKAQVIKHSETGMYKVGKWRIMCLR